jgi:DNA-binding transcriptional LysR family regulator
MRAPITNYFAALRSIEQDAAKTKRSLRAYTPGGMGHRILTARLARLRQDWKDVEAERRAVAAQAAADDIGPCGLSPWEVA